MTLTFDELPEASPSWIRARLQRPAPRRSLARMALVGGATLAFGTFSAINRAAPAWAGFFNDYTNTKTGPCGPNGYASRHTEHGLRCGPSTVCAGQSCCWRWVQGAGNRVGWHAAAPGHAGYYLHRPDHCWGGTYDSWHWKFSDGKTYRCSDGYTCTSRGCFKSICAWSV